MKFWKLFLVIFFFVIPPAIAQEEPPPAENNGFFDTFMGVLGDVAKDTLQEKVDEVAGTYKGKLEQIRLLDRRGDRIVLEVTYKDVKRSDGVTVQGQVLSGGVPLDGFSNLLTPVSGREGKVRLTISQGSQESLDSGWGEASDWGVESEAVAMESDQIQLYLVRETNPDRPFGHLVYDLAKSWTGKNEPDVPPTAADGEGAIELAEDTPLEGSGKTTKPFVPVGVVLAPTKSVTQIKTATPTSPTVKQSTGRTLAAVTAPTSTFDLYKEASKASWRESVHGQLTFGAKRVPASGLVSRHASGKLSTGNAAQDILVTYPSQQKTGWIEGRYPAITLGKNVHFKAVAGFAIGATQSDGARFRVIVDDGKRKTSLISKTVRANRYVNMDGDLSAWAGKKIRIILRVDSGRTAIHDYAVWVKPRLTTK